MASQVLILGASGFIGSYLHKSLGGVEGRIVTGTYHTRAAPGLVPLDILDSKDMLRLINETRPDFVVFLAGTKDVERCERDPAYALHLNVQSVQNYVDACRLAQVQPSTLFFSTDYVFDGRMGHYSATHVPGPHTVYGLTNLLAERILSCSGLSGTNLRVSAVMGRNGGFFKWLESNLHANKSVSLYVNTYFSPTSIGRLCRFVEACAQQVMEPQRGQGMRIAHLSDGYRITRHQFGRAVASRMGKPIDLVQPTAANLEATTFQADLSLLPDNLSAFRPYEDWNEMEEIF